MTGTLLTIAVIVVFWSDQAVGAVTVLGVTLPPGIILAIVGAVVSAWGGVEMSRLVAASDIRTCPVLHAGAAVAGVAIAWLHPMVSDPGILAVIAMGGLSGLLFVSLLVFSSGKTTTGVLPATGCVLATAVWLGVTFGFMMLIRQEWSAWWLLGVIAITKSCDSGAYFTGTLIGRHRLIPWLSPGKTWEGLIGGIVTASIVAVGLAAWSNSALQPISPTLGLAAAAGIGAIIGGVGQLGDLSMSLVKRGANVKDASSLLPGLGGVLDIVDSPLLAAVAAWGLLAWCVAA
jgi:phosphatidate cytidylyltransferase